MDVMSEAGQEVPSFWVVYSDLPTAVDPRLLKWGADMGGEIFVITVEVEVEVTGVTEAVAGGQLRREVATLAVAMS